MSGCLIRGGASAILWVNLESLETTPCRPQAFTTSSSHFSFLPHLPRIALNPDVVFLVVLPPLLYVGGFNTSWRDFHNNIVSILMLAFGLVGFTVVGLALGTRWLIPGFDYRLGAVLGAVVSTTDAIAATAIAKRLGLPRRIVDVLEGESLVNDASGLLALQFAV